MIMSALSSTHEIIELTESYASDSKNRRDTGKQYLGKLSIKDDINKLFEEIEIGSSRRGFGNLERHYRDKSAMKRPMRVGPGPSQAPGIGISETVSLKQALRGLCISQASEMAAVKKRLSRPSASPVVSESGAIKKLYRAVVVESHEDGQSQTSDVVKGNMVEILIVPERSSSNMPHKAPESGLGSITEVSERNRQPSVSWVDSPSQSEKIIKTRMVEEDFTSSPTNRKNEIPESNETVSIADESSKTSRGQHEEGVDKFRTKSLSLHSNVETDQIKISKRGFGITEQSLRAHNVPKKKIVPKRYFVNKNRSQHTEGAKNDRDDHTNNIVRQTPDSALENTVDANAGKHDHVPPLSCKTKSIMTKADERSREKGEFSQSSNSIGEYSSTTSYSEDSYLSGSSRSGYRPHMSKDLRWEAIRSVQKQHGNLGMKHFKLLRKIGGGDIGMVYLSELVGTSCLFAVKVMDNDFLVSRKKMHRAQTEKEILEVLDHPFLPTLYGHFTTKKYSCLVMEYCPGGDLHVLRQRQLTRSFPEKAARFYAAEILLALEYLHMLGVVYRDLKPENILVREDGHIMLSDFDLCLRCTVNPTLLKSSSPIIEPPKKTSSPCSDSSCIDPFCLQPSWQLSCFTPRFLTAAAKTRKLKSELAAQVIPLPQLVVEPTTARSNSFVGTHEYLAPEIIKGEGHGSAVDWWTFGIFLYELLYGKTPFKGSNNEETISNVVSQCLKFPHCPMVSSYGRDLIRRLLKKEPENRLGSAKGAAEIKEHPFFEGLNWALIRCVTPPELPRSFDLGNVVDTGAQRKKSKLPVEFENGGDEIEFEMF